LKSRREGKLRTTIDKDSKETDIAETRISSEPSAFPLLNHPSKFTKKLQLQALRQKLPAGRTVNRTIRELASEQTAEFRQHPAHSVERIKIESILKSRTKQRPLTWYNF
jgi:hypothetical protein